MTMNTSTATGDLTWTGIVQRLAKQLVGHENHDGASLSHLSSNFRQVTAVGESRILPAWALEIFPLLRPIT